MQINSLYDEMRDVFREKLASQWSISAQEVIFGHPVLRNNRCTRTSGIPKQTAAKFTQMLKEQGSLGSRLIDLKPKQDGSRECDW